MIDWNKAPEGATHYAPYNRNFYKLGEKGLEVYTLSGWIWSVLTDLEKLYGAYHNIIERPKMKTVKKKHIHHDLIVKWAADPSQKVWYKSRYGDWRHATKPTWDCGLGYHIGDAPPRETIRIGEFDVPKPLCNKELKVGTEYFCPLVDQGSPSYCSIIFSGSTHNDNVHETKKAALIHSEALRSLTPFKGIYYE